MLVAVMLCAGCGDSGIAPAVTFSIALADGRLCRDAGVGLVSLTVGDESPQRWVCHDAEAPRTITATGLPLAREVDVLGLSPTGTSLYRGRIRAEDVLGATEPTTVLLYPLAVR